MSGSLLDPEGFLTTEGQRRLRGQVAAITARASAFRAFYEGLPDTGGGRILNPDAPFEACFAPYGVEAHEQQVSLLGEDLHTAFAARVSEGLEALWAAAPAGTRTALVTGANGAGKSSLIQDLHGLRAPFDLYLEALEVDPLRLYARLRALKDAGHEVTLLVVHQAPALTTEGVVRRGLDRGRFVSPLAQGRNFATYGAAADLWDPAFSGAFGTLPAEVPLRVKTGTGRLLGGAEAVAFLCEAEAAFRAGGGAHGVRERAREAYRRAAAEGHPPALQRALRHHAGAP